MKIFTVFAVAFVIAFGLTLQGQTLPVAVATSSIQWDYLTTQLQSGGVIKFQTALVPQGQTISDADYKDATPVVTPMADGTGSTYTVSLAGTTVGNHTFAIRACNVDMCGDAATLDFRFTAKPGAVLNPRLNGGK